MHLDLEAEPAVRAPSKAKSSWSSSIIDGGPTIAVSMLSSHIGVEVAQVAGSPALRDNPRHAVHDGGFHHGRADFALGIEVGRWLR